MKNIVHNIKQLIDSGNLDEAERAITEALNQNPDSTELLALKAEVSLKLGADLWEKGDVDRALDYLTQALKINPSDQNTVLKCGEVLISLEQVESAKNLYSSYLEKNPDDKEIAQALKSLDIVSTVLESNAFENIQQEERIKVSAIVSAYNSERFIRGCLEDLVNQTLYQKGELEIIVIDSGSQQNEKSIVEEFQKNYKNIVYIRTEERETIYKSWNRGIKAARGKYITNANADDRHRKDALEYMASILDGSPDIGLVYADVIITAKENETFENHTPIGAYRWLDYSREFLTLGCFVGPQPMWRKSLHEKYGYFDESFTSSGDWEFWLRIAEGPEMLHIPEFLGLYLFSPQSAEHRDQSTRIQEDMRIRQKYVQKYLATLDDIERGLKKVDELTLKTGDYRPYKPIKDILNKMRDEILSKEPLQVSSFDRDLLRTSNTQKEEKQGISLDEDKIAYPVQYKKGLNSIIIFISNHASYIEKCLESIKKHTREPHEIILVPLEVSYENSGYLEKIVKKDANIRIVESMKPEIATHPESIRSARNDKTEFHRNLTYPEAVNKGIAEAKGEYVVVLNDDVIVTEGWLSSMLEHLNSADDIGIVSPMTVNVDGPQGVKIAKSEEQRARSKEGEVIARSVATKQSQDNLHSFASAFRERNRYRRIETVNLNGFCMLFKRELTKKIGFMDERLEIPDFADNDYCLRSAVEGYRNIIAGDVFVYSHRDRTLTGRGGKIGSLLPKISKLFFDKWNNLHPSTLLGKKMLVLNSISASNDLRQKGKYSEAIQVLSAVKELQPDENKYYFTFAEILIEQNRLIEAINILENMPKSLKDNAESLALIGYCKVLMNQLEEAEKFADNALELNKTASKALNLKGLIALKKENFSEAENFFYQAIESDRSYNEPYLNLGQLKWGEGKTEEAFTLYEKAFILNPANNATIDKFFDSAVTLRKLGHAEKIMREAIDIYPSHKKLRHSFAEVLLKQEKKHEAMDVLEDTLLYCGVDDDTLSFALKVRHEIGPKEILKDTPLNPPLIRGKSEEDHCEERSDVAISNQSHEKTRLPRHDFVGSRNDKKSTISLCMIVKNEESNLVNCLSKVGSLVDEIIVVDTGSTDRTKDIAKAFGAKVFDFKWTNDFSAARNFSLSKATGDWILILDADEVISPKDHEALRLLTLTSKLVAYSFTTRNYQHNVIMEWVANDGQYLEEEAGTGWFPSYKVRLFPNNPQIRFINPVHELVEESLIRSGIEIRKTDIPVHHYGKIQVDRKKEKSDQYYKLGIQKLSSKGEQDLHALYELALQTTELENYEEAMSLWEKLSQKKPDFARAHIGLGNLYFQLGRYDDAISSFRKALQLEPNSRDPIVLYAKSYIFGGNVEASIPILEKLLQKEPSYPPALGLISAAYFCSDRKKEGFIYAKKLDETNFDASRFFKSFASSLIKTGQLIYAYKVLEAAIEGNYVTEEIQTLLEECRRELSADERTRLPRPDFVGSCNDKRATISLCMIVKNEAENIGRCLSCVKGLVDEIIVVDTGSTDRTKKIARKFGAKVFNFKWTNDFSEARNFSLSKATGDWILILDADELISPRNHERIRELVKKPLAYSFTTRNYIMELNNIDWKPNDGNYSEEAGTGWFPGEKVRLFPNKPGIKFDFPIHERIEPSLIKMGIKIESSDIPVHHYGTLYREKENKKSEIYYEMAKKKVFEDKISDFRALHELAIHASNLGKFEEALEYLEKVLELNPDFGRAYLSRGNNYFNLRKFNEALSSYIKALELDPELKEAIIQAASCEFYLGKSAPAVSRLEKFIQKDPEHLKALALLAIGHLSLRHKINAQQIIEKLKILNFDYKNFISHSVNTLTCFGQIDSAISLFESAIETGSVDENSEQLLSTLYMIKRLNESKSKVSVVVLASDNSDNLNKCIESIKRSTLEPHEAIVIPKENSPSPLSPPLKVGDDKPSSLKPQGKITYIQAVNKGIKESSGDYIVLINDDVLVTDCWLTGILECAMSNPNIGLVGPMMTNIEGPQGVKRAEGEEQRAKSSGLLGLNEFALSFRQKNRHRYIEQKKLTGECFLIKRELLENIGLFDEHFQTPEYTLDDYCLRASLNNYRSLIAGDVVVHKIEHADKEDVVKIREDTIAYNKILSADRKHFIDKWSANDVDEETRKKLITLNSIRYADELAQQGQKNNAIQAINEGLKYSPFDERLHFALVMYMTENGKYIEAYDILEKMSANHKKDARWFELASICKNGIHIYDKAEKYADEAIILDNKYAKAWNLKGLIYYNKGLFDEAEKFFTKAIELDRSYGEAYANLGAIKWNKNYKEEAINLFERAFILSPTVENVVINYHAVAVSLSQQQRAEKIFKEAIDLYPSNRRLKYVLVDLLLQHEKYEEAMEIYEDAMVAFGIDDDTLSIALGIRNKIGPKDLVRGGEFKGGHYEESRPNIHRDRGDKAISGYSPTISLCMIVKNEEKYIGKCLHSIKPLVDEMIVVDTGSTDKTKNIAKAFGAKAYDFAWTGDFSEARNYSISKASGDWILVLDADEVIAPFDQDVLRKLLSLPAYKSAGFTITSRNYVLPVSTIGWRPNDGSYIKQEAGTGWFPSDKVRIFPNNPHIRFEFPVHEFVEMTMQKAGIKNIIIDIPVHHYGKLEKDKIFTKGEDYYILGKLKLSERGEKDFIALYELAVQASELERFDEALEYWKKLTEVKPDFAKAFFGLANSYYRQSKFQEAIDSLETALELEKNPEEQKEYVSLYAACSICIGKAEKCISLLKDTLSKYPELPMVMLMLALVYCCINKKDDAKKYLSLLKKKRMNYDNYLYEFAEFLIKAGNFNYAISIIETALDIGTQDERFLILLDRCKKLLTEEI